MAELIQNVATVIALLIWCGIGIFVTYKTWKLSKRIDDLLDALDEDIKNGY